MRASIGKIAAPVLYMRNISTDKTGPPKIKQLFTFFLNTKHFFCHSGQFILYSIKKDQRLEFKETARRKILAPEPDIKHQWD